MPSANLQAVRDVFEEWSKGNLRAGVDLYDPDIVFIPYRNLPYAGRYIGPEGIREFMAQWLDSMADVTLGAEELIEADNSVVVSMIQGGVGKESGARTELRYCEVWTFRGSTVIRREAFEHRADAMTAVGLDT